MKEGCSSIDVANLFMQIAQFCQVRRFCIHVTYCQPFVREVLSLPPRSARLKALMASARRPSFS
jgi:hypothetical protein